MRGEQSRAAALFDVGGDKNDDDTDDDDDVFVGGGGGGGGVGACANMYGRKPTSSFCVKQQSKDTKSKSSKRSLSIFPLLCVCLI